MSDPSRSSYSRANDIAVDALKQLVTLASLILALTITFLKDALGDSRGVALLTILVPLSWALLLFALWNGWVAIADSAKRLGNSTAADEAYVFDRVAKNRSKSESERTRPGRLARRAPWSLFGGLVALAVFGVANWRLLFSEAERREAKTGEPAIFVTDSSQHYVITSAHTCRLCERCRGPRRSAH